MNRFKGEVPLALPDKRTFVLVMDQEALLEAETAYGKPLPALLADMGAGFVSASRALLWGGLKAKQPQVTLREAGAILFEHGELVATALAEAIEAAFPDARSDNGASAEGNGASPRGGKTSGGSGAKRGSSRKTSGAPHRAPSP